MCHLHSIFNIQYSTVQKPQVAQLLDELLLREAGLFLGQVRILKDLLLSIAARPALNSLRRRASSWPGAHSEYSTLTACTHTHSYKQSQPP